MLEALISKVLWYGIAIGPAVYCIVLSVRSEGTKPDRQALLFALGFTAMMAGVRTYWLDERKADLDTVCSELATYVDGELPESCYPEEIEENPFPPEY